MIKYFIIVITILLMILLASMYKPNTSLYVHPASLPKPSFDPN